MALEWSEKSEKGRVYVGGGYLSHGLKNKDPICNKTYNTNGAMYCGVLYTHYPIKSLPLSMKPVIYLLGYTDTWTCQTSIYPALFGLAWGFTLKLNTTCRIAICSTVTLTLHKQNI